MCGQTYLCWMTMGKGDTLARKGELVTEQEFEQAVLRIRSGDKDGLKEIYLAYVKFIYSVIFEILKNRESTEDVTSEFFIKLWDIADSYKPGNGHKGYLAAIARNMAIDWIRKHKREVLLSDPDLGETVRMNENTGDAAAGMQSGNRKAGGVGIPTDMENRPVENEVVGNIAIQEALAQLKDGERQIVNMKVLGDMTFREIAEVLHMPMGTVTWKYQNAIKKLRRCGYE